MKSTATITDNLTNPTWNITLRTYRQIYKYLLLYLSRNSRFLLLISTSANALDEERPIINSTSDLRTTLRTTITTLFSIDKWKTYYMQIMNFYITSWHSESSLNSTVDLTTKDLKRFEFLFLVRTLAIKYWLFIIQ